MISDPVLNTFARKCALCDEWATGTWGRPLGKVPPETGEVFTCKEHWLAIYNEAAKAATYDAHFADHRGHPGATDHRLRPLWKQAMINCAIWDARAPYPSSPVIINPRKATK